MIFEELTKLKDEPIKPEIEKIDLSSRYLECLTNPDANKPWFIVLGEIKREYQGKNVSFTIRLKWNEIPEGKRGVAAIQLKAFLQDERVKENAVCVIEINLEEKETLRKGYDPEYMSCQNAFASGVKLEIV